VHPTFRCFPKEGNSKAVNSLRTKRRIWLRNDNEKYASVRVRTLGCASIIKKCKHRRFLPIEKSFHFATPRQTLNGCHIRLLIIHETTSCNHAFWIVENRFQFLRSIQKQPAGVCHRTSKLNNHFNFYNRNVLAKDRHHDGEEYSLVEDSRKEKAVISEFHREATPNGIMKVVSKEWS